MVVLRQIKKAIKNFLEKLAKENEKTFGLGILDYCRLNRSVSGNSSKK